MLPFKIDPTSSLRLWACEICNTITELDAQQIHLSSEFHANNLKAQHKPPPEQTLFYDAVEAQYYSCTVCNVTVAAELQESHEAGRRHRVRAAASAEFGFTITNHSDFLFPAREFLPTAIDVWTCTICSVTVIAEDQGSHEASKAHKTKLNQQVWICTICQVTLTVGCRVSHEAGKRHQGMISLQPWTCTICNVTLTVASQAAHEATDAHRVMASPLTWTCISCNVTVGVEFKGRHEASKWHQERVNPQTLNCEICDVTLVDVVSERYHQVGKRHLAKIAALTQSKGTTVVNTPIVTSLSPEKPSTAPRTWTCKICEITIAIDSRESHLSGKRHHKKETTLIQLGKEEEIATPTVVAPIPQLSSTTQGTWTCTLCNTTIDTNSRGPHEASKSHRRALRPCEICDAMVCLDTQAPHEAGKKHQKGLRALEERRKDTINLPHIAVPQPTKSHTAPRIPTSGSVANIDRQEPHVGKGYVESPNLLPWTCKICAVTIPVELQENHEKTKKHLAKAKMQPWTCIICSITLTIGSKESHEAGRKHRAEVTRKETVAAIPPSMPPSIVEPVLQLPGGTLPGAVERGESCVDKDYPEGSGTQTWTCTVCDITMGMEFRESHKSGKRHCRIVAAMNTRDSGNIPTDRLKKQNPVYKGWLWTGRKARRAAQDVGVE